MATVTSLGWDASRMGDEVVNELVAFIRAQLVEDATAAPGIHDVNCQSVRYRAFGDACDCGVPARMLRGVEWKRKLLPVHGAGMDEGDTMAHECPDEINPSSSAYGVTTGFERDCLTLRLLASEWSDHPGYRPEWMP